MNMKSTDIIKNRENLDKDIKRYWSIIRSENVVDKGTKRNYDMKNMLNLIMKLSNDRVLTKLDSLCINLGFTSRDAFPKDSIYPIIYELSEKNEMFVQLGLIPTINTNLKTKLGKKKLFKDEEITADYITKLKNSLQLEINGLKKKLEDFNTKATLDVSKAYAFLTA